MDGLANGADTMACANCGAEMRRGMLRCRECGQSTVETADEEFELTGHQLVTPSQEAKCPLCGAFLEPGTTDCAKCTSDLLDQLLNGPDQGEPGTGGSPTDSNSATSRPPSPAPKLHVRRAAHVGNRERANPGIGPSSKLREAPSLPPQANSPTTKTKPAAAPQPGSKSVPQFASPEEIQAANQQAVNQHAASKQVESEVDDAAGEDEEAGGSTTVETSAACTALLASLATADAQLRCGIATALGKLGDKMALVPLERHLTDQDIRVRRAVAAALVQLGHPKGQTLLDIAERKPAAAVIKEQRSAAAPKPRPRASSGGGIDGGTLKILGGAVLAIAIAGGGVWYWMSSSPSTGSKKAKSAAAKKAAAKKAAKKTKVEAE
jgi:hypothetical protein